MKYILRNIITVLTASEKSSFILLIFLNTIVSIADIALLALLVYTVNFYTSGLNAFQTAWLPEIFRKHESLLLIAFVLLLFTVKNVTAYFVIVKQHRFVYTVAARMSHNNLLKYLSGNYLDYVNTDSAVHIRKISQQPIEFCNYLLLGFQQIITESVLIILSVTAILFFDTKLFLLLLVMLLPPVLTISFLSRRRLKSARKNVQSSNETALQYLQEAIGGYIESCIYGRKEYFAKRYAHYQYRFNNFLAELQIVQNLPSRLLEVFAVLGLFLLILTSKITHSSVLVNITTIGAFIAAAYKIIPGVVKIFNLSGQMKTYEFTLHDLMKETEQSQGVLLSAAQNHIHSVTFENVSFYYHDQAFLENFSITIKAGEITGIAGRSGKGKTTIINLLLGFLLPGKGEILFNDSVADVHERKSYWKRISYAKQQTFLLHDTILKNIILDNENYDKARLDKAVEISGLASIISQYGEGIHKIIAEKGKNISGGQRQRIAIARALYKDADFLILDEPFSELDDASMQQMMQHLQELANEGKMILLISHNEKSLSYCAKTFALNE